MMKVEGRSPSKRKRNMQANAWIHEPPKTDEQRSALRSKIAEQYRIAHQAPTILLCACCETAVQIASMFRCYDCHLYFCSACARVHFGRGH